MHEFFFIPILKQAVKGGFLNFVDRASLRDFRVRECDGVEIWTSKDGFITLGTFIDIIYSHDFARGYFGQAIVCGECGFPSTDCHVDHLNEDCDCEDECVKRVAWQYHLQQMVLADAPEQYLQKYYA